MNGYHVCENDVVIQPYQYFARSGEAIYEWKDTFLHVDRDGTIIFKSKGFNTSQINHLKKRKTNKFVKAFLDCLHLNDNVIPEEIELLKKIDCKTKVIIGGCGRSGTTLMLSVLGAHSQVFAIPEETHAFYPYPWKPNRILSYLKTRNFNVWCEKTPKNILVYDKILDRLGENTRIINMIRDGRDVITSQHPNGKNKYCVDEDRWINDNSLDYKDKRILNVKFEELITHPKAILTSICNHIGLEFEESLLQYHRITNVSNNIAWKDQATPIGRNNSETKNNRWDCPEVADLMSDTRALEIMKRFRYI